MQSFSQSVIQISYACFGFCWPFCCLDLNGVLKPELVFVWLYVVIRQVKVKVPVHAALICCFICKLISHLIAVYAYMRFDFEQDCFIPCLCSLHDLVAYRFEQRSVAIVDDGDLRCMPIFCTEHFESVAMLSFTPGLQCLTAITSATSSALLMVFSMPCPYGRTLRLRCACLCSLYTPEPVTRPMPGISFLLPSVHMISSGQNLSSVLWKTWLNSSLFGCFSGDHAVAVVFVALEQCLGGYSPGGETVCCMVIFSCFGLCGGFPS